MHHLNIYLVCCEMSAIDTARSLETGKGLRIQNQSIGIQSHQPYMYIDLHQIGVYIYLGHILPISDHGRIVLVAVHACISFAICSSM